ncbi:sensor histidine kinase [Roseovarius sp. MS2]|uniref:sensor histidine kinase n=1 Tax=Roseovarius TaxID=74030 RepID=UPI003EDBC1EB
MTDPAKYRRQIEILRHADATSVTEILTRYAIVIGAALLLWISTGQTLMLIWGFVYTVLNGVYIFVLRAPNLPKTRGAYCALFLASMIISTWYAAMTIYLTTLDSRAYEFIGICGLIGLGLYNLSRHTDLTFLALWDTLLLTLCVIGIVLAFVAKTETQSHQVAIVFAGFGINAYYMMTYLSMMRTRATLRSAQEAEVQSQKMRAVGQLTSGIAHDFNNILTVIRGNLDLASELPNLAERELMLDEARAGTDRAAHLVRQLLAFSRKSQMMRSDIALGPFLEDFAVSLRRLLPETVRIALSGTLPDLSLRADRQLLETALLNCAINARDAMHPEGGILRLSAVVDTAAHEVAILIEDTGPGVPPAMIDRITEPFFTTKQVGEGSGLGLSMVKGFAEQSGGRLELRNHPSHGLQVALILPLV